MNPITTSAATEPLARPEEDYCEKHNIKHSWEPGPTLTSNPGWATRRCANCGKTQRQSLAEQPWLDD